MPEERIQKVLATAGVASRRQAEVLVATGRVRIDGKVAVVGQKVDPMVSTIDVNGTPIGIGVARAYVALHKPAGVTSTTRDRHANTTVLDLIPTALVPDGTRLYPVGRLDLDSEGLLLLTNDGDWAERVLHPRFGVEREYALAVVQPLVPEQVRLLNAGIRLDEGLGKLAAPLRATTSVENRQLAGALHPAPDPNLVWYRATLAQGWKRQLRRMFGAVDAPILRLVRVRIGIVRLGDLRSGRARNLKAPEIKGLAALGSNRASSGPVPGGRSSSSTGALSAVPKRRSLRDVSGSIAGRPGHVPPEGDYPTGIARVDRNPRRSADEHLGGATAEPRRPPSSRGERATRSSRQRET